LKNRTLLVCLLFIVFCSCKKVEPIKESDTVYFPVDLNTYNVYTVTELKHDAFLAQTDTSYFFVKETTQDTLINNAGELVYRVKVEKSTDDTLYSFHKYLIIQRDEFSAQRVEDDIRKIKLSFPFKERKSWDANELNTSDYQLARTIQLGETIILEGIEHKETVTVDLGSDIDPFFTNVEEEIYAKNTGLVRRIFKDLQTQPGKYKDGIEYEQTFYRSKR
jgi:hypothetical protein